MQNVWIYKKRYCQVAWYLKNANSCVMCGIGEFSLPAKQSFLQSQNGSSKAW